jgi:hypothetical protein
MQSNWKAVVVLEFKTVYTLQQKCRENDRKVISLYYIGMKDTMGIFFLSVFPSIYHSTLTFPSSNDVENDKLTAPDRRPIMLT